MSNKNLFIACVLLVSEMVVGQNIPDANFAQAIRNVCPACIDVSNNLTPAATTLTTLDVSNKSIVNLTGLNGFSSLSVFWCESNNITTLPTLPAALTQLYCGFNQISSLPALPVNLKILSVKGNLLTALPTLPTVLEKLNINQNKITSLPTLPSTLMSISAFDNKLTALPSLPNSLEILGVNTNLLTSIPTLPPFLYFLDVGGNSGLNCLPTLPNGLTSLTTTLTNITCLLNHPSGLTTSLPLCGGGSCGAPLPVDLIAFDLKNNRNYIELNWVTASEMGFDHFVIEQSTDGMHFTPLSKKAAEGSTRGMTHYSFIDFSPAEGVNYYRLRMNDADGTYAYSKTKSILFGEAPDCRIYPNPMQDEMTIEVAGKFGAKTRVLLMDVAGTVLFDNTLTENQKWDVSRLAVGIYFLKVIQNGRISEQKIVKQ